MIDTDTHNLEYFFSFKGDMADMVDYEKQQCLAVIQKIVQITQFHNQKELAEKSGKIFEN